MARKKDFTSKDADIISNIINTDNTNDTKDTTNTANTTYRFNACFTQLQGQYLNEKRWRSRKSITKLLQELVEEDMKKHPEIVAGIDELNS